MRAKSSTGFAIPLELEAEKRKTESYPKRAASAQNADIDASSIALDSPRSADYDVIGEYGALQIADGLYNHDFYLHKILDPDNVRPYGDTLRDFYSAIDRDLSGVITRPPTPTLFGKRGYPESLGHLKEEFYNRLTISDDRSAGSEIEERNLLALRDRDTKIREPQKLRRRSVVPGLTASNQSAKMSIQAHPSAGAPSMVPSTDTSEVVDDHRIIIDIKQVLDETDPSEVGLRKRQEYIDLLQESIQSRSAPSKYKIIYRIQKSEFDYQHGDKSYEQRGKLFFDHPEWVHGQGTDKQIKSNSPLTNFELYLEKNKNISFIVYRNFHDNFSRVVDQPGDENIQGDGTADRPRHANETVRLVNKDLIKAIEALLQTQQHYTDLAHEFSQSFELPAPYLFIFHSRKSLENFQESLPVHAKTQLALLLKYVTAHYADEYATADSLLSQSKISPKFLRYLFKPGDLLFSRVDGNYQGYVSKSWPMKTRTEIRMRAATSPSDKMTVHSCDIDAWHWNFDGNFQRQSSTLCLEIIEDEENNTDIKAKRGITAQGDKPGNDTGEKNISDLNVFPMQYASAEIVDNCRRRGKTFWKCRVRSYISYQATERDSIQNLVDERYMIDLKTYRSLHLHSQSGLRDEVGPEALARSVPPDERFELLLPLEIKGYNLRLKKWFDLAADRISDVKWNKEAFQNLVIDRKARDLIRALVSNQIAAEKSTDLIMGKGNGLILLLHGGPGTGKTLTAESVAEIAEKPLYRVTCGDVGIKAEEVEKYLESVLYLGKIWGCVVLLDEADVFLEQRSLEDMKRNALVSVFLRVLEYYEGILVLTSNRVGTFDEAFKSRIQLALHYPVLGPYQRLRIWENFINRLESFGDDDKVDIADLRDHLEDLKEEKMNGRQIRNAITTARQYAEWKGSVLTYKHLSDVIEVSGRFDKYLDKLNGGFTQDQLAEDEGLRLDDSK